MDDPLSSSTDSDGSTIFEVAYVMDNIHNLPLTAVNAGDQTRGLPNQQREITVSESQDMIGYETDIEGYAEQPQPLSMDDSSVGHRLRYPGDHDGYLGNKGLQIGESSGIGGAGMYDAFNGMESSEGLSKRKLKKTLDIVVDGDCYILRFEKEVDKNKIIRTQPWQMLGYLLVLKPFSPNLTPNELDFSKQALWVVFEGLHLEHQNPTLIKLIARAAGKWIYITSPLHQGRLVDTMNRGEVWVTFTYVGTPFHTYWKCFKLGHSSYDCHMISDPIQVPLALPPIAQEIMNEMNILDPAPAIVHNHQLILDRDLDAEAERNHQIALFGGSGVLITANS
ncbi:hypothetical protein IFM89_032878 [Coptis chinensis]|uniref:DUF4283 domain-containing protein n=1 Tax=Coptis chinensis TaxID=261450 RepID=A0A835MAR2_9MAGN|nr:hypothetical protein IFM89_032878 [Coptis chinensis]